MGGSSSLAITKNHLENAFHSITKNTTKCRSIANVEQSLTMKGNNNTISNLNMDQYFTYTLDCINNTQLQQKILNDIKDNLKAAAKAADSSILPLGHDGTMVANDIENKFDTYINNTSLTTLLNNINSSQNVSMIGNRNKLLNGKLDSTVVASAKAISNLVSQIDSVKTMIQNTGADASTEVTSSFSNMMIIFGVIAGIVAVICSIFVLPKYFDSVNKNPQLLMLGGNNLSNYSSIPNT